MTKLRRVILASSSPRRIELLKQFGIEFEVIPSNVDESIDQSLSVEENVMQLAKKKAQEVFNKLGEDSKQSLVIAADTVVFVEGVILGKPSNEDEAFWMLRKISGKWHTVYTGVCIIDGPSERILVEYEKSNVYIKQMSDEEILSYISTKEPFDKAGAYAIQGFGSLIVERIEGCFYNVVGLPLYKLNIMLQKLGYDLMKGEL
ncbi:maf protein [Caldicellulosiruptor acetigenus I77R1B]|uniref:dTTP/UTP pyrophosphatase n=1 Tax=Caldicellulosiruptor acetigenus (strain ATCC 700853 / DSM 12137 / I77R1B) TaxID=632335 RepID=E4S7Q2_CALA7|nr:Maf family protein [Caldicellulosiruptor acetigenus]ADQ40792.1 maf protein [Caldicellulosiruptor acetigenus I77R1B]WAM35110.1 Maf family protein [Caldicellulosiruptor acetigenus]